MFTCRIIHGDQEVISKILKILNLHLNLKKFVFRNFKNSIFMVLGTFTIEI